LSGFGFILIIVAFFFLYFVLVRPQKRRQLEQQRMLSDLKVGDEVVTAGGIYGEITGIEEDDELRVRIAPELEVKVARRAVGGVVSRETDEETFEEPDEPDRAQPTPGT
jgi:preprotein translocase subunit YajC